MKHRIKKMKKFVGLLVCSMILCCGQTVCAEDEDIRISGKEYLVNLNNASRLYMCNEKAVSGEVGSKVFFTYTVDKVMQNAIYRNGVLATIDNATPAPFSGKGKMFYSSLTSLYDEGYTYVFRFERTEEGFEYHCAKMKGEETITINFPNQTSGSATDAYTHYGIFFDCKTDGVSAILNHVRCYDEKGNDLGIYFNEPTGATNVLLDVHHIIDSKYSFTLDDVHTVAISSKYPTDSKVVYMEYEVENVTKDNTYQQGLVASWKPKDLYPHSSSNGVILWKPVEKEATNKLMLREGGKYFVCFVKKGTGFEGIVQCTVNGKTETTTFASKECSPYFQYYSVWLGESEGHEISATFKNVKCYDADGNSLGIQLNHNDIPITHVGEYEDYSETEAVYYCKENQGFIILEDEKRATKQVGIRKEECTYRFIDDEELCLILESGKEMYAYSSLLITDEEGNTYSRLKDSKVTFVTGDKTATARVTADSGYRVEEPEAPVKEGNTFKGWYLGDGEAFDFETVVTESITLYAKWQDGDGNEYLDIVQDDVVDSSEKAMIIGVAASTIIITASVIGCVWILRRKRENEKR